MENKTEQAFAVPGQRGIIDTINPATGRSSCYGDDLDGIRARYPGAVVVNVEQHFNELGRQQDAEPWNWSECGENQYEDMLNVLPPEAWEQGAFLVGETMDHHFTTGKPRFTCCRHRHGKFEVLSRPITVAEFRAMLHPATVPA